MQLKYQVFFCLYACKMAHKLGMGFPEEPSVKQSFQARIQIIAVAAVKFIFGNAISSMVSSKNWSWKWIVN